MLIWEVSSPTLEIRRYELKGEGMCKCRFHSEVIDKTAKHDN
jgi:hypothetical protein